MYQLQLFQNGYGKIRIRKRVHEYQNQLREVSKMSILYFFFAACAHVRRSDETAPDNIT